MLKYAYKNIYANPSKNDIANQLIFNDMKDTPKYTKK